MHIIGTGLIARNLRPLRDRRPDVTVLAAGVPGHHRPESEHQRETDLVRSTIRDCLDRGHTLVFLSTTSMYGAAGGGGREDEPVRSSTSYGEHKLRLEDTVRDSGVPHLILRLTQVTGPGEPSTRLLPTLIAQIGSGRVRVSRSARRDLLHVEDFTAIVAGLLSSTARDEVVNVASGDCVPVSQIVDHLEHRLQAHAEREMIDDGVAYCSSIAKLRALVPETTRMGFTPGYFRQVIDRYLAAGPVPGRQSGRCAAEPSNAR